MTRWLPILALLAACGGDDVTTVDAGSGDAGVDASSAAPVTVEVHDQTGRPLAGIPVVFGNADGTVRAEVATSSVGEASSVVPAGGMITAVQLTPGTPIRSRLRTVTGVQPGDRLRVTLTANATAAALIGPVAVPAPPNPPVGTTQYVVDFGCSSNTGPTGVSPIMLDGSCLRPGSNLIDVSITAEAADDSQLAFAVATAVPLAASGTTTVTFPGGWRTDFATLRLDLLNQPGWALSAATQVQLQSAGPTRYASVSATAITPGQALSQVLKFPAGIATAMLYEVDLAGMAGSHLTLSALARSKTSVVATDSFDLATLLAPITSVAVDATTARPRVTWTLGPGAAGADVAYANVSWQSTGVHGSWTMALPPDVSPAATFPALPDDLASNGPPADGSAVVTAGVDYDDVSTWRGYPDARAGLPVVAPYDERYSYY